MIEWERVIKKGLAIAMSAMMAVTVLPTAVYADNSLLKKDPEP